MVQSTIRIGFLTALVTLIFASGSVLAQRGISYEQLASQQREQSIFFDYFTLPGSQPGTVQFVTTFRIDYNLLPFKKYNRQVEEKNFFSPASMNIELFSDPDATAKNKRRKDEFSVEGLEPVAREAWQDTAFAQNYEETKSNNRFITGQLVTELKPGSYSYILRFTRGDEVDGRISRRRSVIIEPYSERKKGQVILVENVKKQDSGNSLGSLQLLNFGDNVYYGKDFHTFVHLPGYNASDTYTFQVDRMDISSRDTTKQDGVISEQISGEQIYTGIRPLLHQESNEEFIRLEKANNGSAYALLKIPNSQFMNAVYRLRVLKGQQPVAQSIFRSRWIEMPTSLLNVNVAIDMMRFIVDDSTIREMRSGSNAEKEEKFRSFWDKRDPTPNTEFNELMAEYYRRVDYAYEQFSTINVQGYNTDQGKIYIQYGPPQNIERKFPPGEPAVEIWEYKNRSFVFRAVSGFGEFKLVSDK